MCPLQHLATLCHPHLPELAPGSSSLAIPLGLVAWSKVVSCSLEEEPRSLRTQKQQAEPLRADLDQDQVSNFLTPIYQRAAGT